ncbi:SCND3 protein, partial [Amia calva]|nr:SCND3 protein [Amia calva]
MHSHHLKLNLSKSDRLFFPHSSSPSADLPISIPLKSTTLSPSSSAKNLGVTLDPALSYTQHITTLTCTCRFFLSNICRIHPFLTDYSTQLLVQSLVLSHLDYCNSLLAGLPASTTHPLQLIQNSAARLVSSLPRFAHATPLLRSLHWLPIVAHIQFKTLTLKYRCLNHTVPSYLQSLVSPYIPSRPLCSSSARRLTLPPLHSPWCMNAVAETLLDGKQKDELCEKIKQIPMSRTTTARKSEILTEDVLTQLDDAIQSAPCIALAVDKSTDVSDNAQLLVYVRFYHTEKKAFCEDLLGVTSLETHTRGKDIYMAIKEMLRKRGIDLKQVVSITSDGAPAMIGRERGAVAHLNPELTAYHCIIRQSVLCANLSEEYAQVMNIIMKLINFLRASSSQHRLLREFLKEVEANANDLLLHNNVRWLSKGRVLERFWSIRKEITAFLVQLKSQKATQFSLFLQDESKMDIVAFLVDITSHLNELNVKLQGKNNSVCDLMTAVRSFQRKLEVFVALHTLTMFGATYSCEPSFSTMNIIKNKYHSRLTNEHLHMCMRMALTPFQPRFKLLAGQAKAHFSH